MLPPLVVPRFMPVKGVLVVTRNNGALEVRMRTRIIAPSDARSYVRVYFTAKAGLPPPSGDTDII